MLIWCDVETTGLDPERDLLLEVGFIATSDDLLKVTNGCSALVGYEGIFVSDVTAMMPPEVLKMHTDNDLIESYTNMRMRHEAVVTQIMAWFASLGVEPGTVPLAGSSVHFDRGFLALHMPEVERFFHYRNVDISSVKEMVKRWRPDVAETLPEPRKSHRVIDDLMDTIEEARHYKRHIFDAEPIEYPEVTLRRKF